MFDVLVVGAGVVGSLIARKLSRYDLKTIVLDKENDAGNVTSMANSAIVHSGYDPVPGTLKAKFNVLGNKMYPELCKDLDVHFEKIGSMTVALYDEQLPMLKELAERSKLNGVEVKLLSKEEVQQYGLEQIEINVSAAQFDHENPAKLVIECIEKYHINPSQINLEITETAAGKNKTIMIQNMEKLIDKGVTFSLDDFGTGRSNIDYFVNMPVRTIKFDYTFTRGFFDNEKIKHVLTGMLDIIHKMNLSVVVEGIETKEQMQVMKAMGVEYIQGFYYSKPIPENEFMEFLRQNN